MSDSPNAKRSPRPARRRDDGDDAAVRALRDKLSGVLRRLPDIERRVVEQRMGLVDGTPAKPGEVAERLGLTIHEVKTIEERAFSRIREVGPIKGLEKFLGR
jgi:DNA-directed RNA polymerase sigma subunit (sigma70/sigma32)